MPQLADVFTLRRERPARPVPHTLGVFEAHSTTMKSTTPLKGITAALGWSRAYEPEGLVTNLRPGLPTWLAWRALQCGWRLTVVVASAQLNRAPSDVQEPLFELFHRADEKHVVDSVFDRDAFVQKFPCVSIEHIMGLTLPIMGSRVVSSD